MPDPVSYIAVLPIRESTVAFVSGLLFGERARRGTRRGRRALGCYRHAIMVLRWFLAPPGSLNSPATTRSVPPRPTATYTKRSTCWPARRRVCMAHCSPPSTAGHTHVRLDGPLIRTDRCRRSARRPGWTCGGRASTKQAPPARRERPGRYRPGPLVVVDLRRATRPRARHHLRPRPSQAARRADRLDRRGPRRARRSGLRRREHPAHLSDQEHPRRRPHRRAAHPSMLCTPPPARWPNVGTRCSRPPSNRYAGSACARGASARSSPPRWSCSTRSATAQHGQT
jgi:hypothetical protein